MLAIITLLTSLIFAAMYPLCFWLSAREPLKNNFHHFHLGLPAIVAAIIAFWLPQVKMPENIIYVGYIWSILLFLITLISWKKETVQLFSISVSALIGLILFSMIHYHLIKHSTPAMIIMGIINGGIFCSSLYAMNLGHWYLNVHGLDIKHLKNAVYLFWAFVLIRFIWDAGALFIQSVTYAGESLALYSFIGTSDGILIIIGVLFGVLVPLVCLWFVHEILKLKNTQAATGILYVILCAVLVGDIAFKYYLIKYGIVL